MLVSDPTARASTTTVTILLAPSGRSATWKVTTPFDGAAPPVAETNVAPSGTVTTSVTPVAAAGPWLVTVVVQVSGCPTITDLGGATVVTCRSATGISVVATVVVAPAELLEAFGSAVEDETEAVSAIVAAGDATSSTRTTRVNVATAADSSVVAAAEIVPVLPAAGVVAVQPAGAVNETNVVFAGTSSVSETSWAASGPAFGR